MDAACIFVHRLLHRFFKRLGCDPYICRIRCIMTLDFSNPAFRRCFIRLRHRRAFRIYRCRTRRYLTFDHCPRHILLRCTTCDVARSKKPFYRRRAVSIDPVAACRMTADDIRFCSFDLDIMGIGTVFFHPLQRLRRCHVEIGTQKIAFFFRSNALGMQVARTMPRSVFLNSTINTLWCRDAVFRFVDLTLCIDLFCTNALGNRPRRRYRILASKRDKAIFKRRHLCPCANPHRKAGACVKR